MTEPNDRYSETGQKDDAGKAPLDLLPWDSVLGAAEVMGFGARKYAPQNWHGLSKSRLFGAALRHFVAWWRGEDDDAETGMPHLHHAAACALMLAAAEGRDDRGARDVVRVNGAVPLPPIRREALSKRLRADHSGFRRLADEVEELELRAGVEL